MEIQPELALEQLYKTTRFIKLPAQEHEYLRLCAETIEKALQNPLIAKSKGVKATKPIETVK